MEQRVAELEKKVQELEAALKKSNENTTLVLEIIEEYRDEYLEDLDYSLRKEKMARRRDSMNQIRARGTDSAKVIQVIETKALKGSGTEKDPFRIVIQYWGLEGDLLAEKREGGPKNDPRLQPDVYYPWEIEPGE